MKPRDHVRQYHKESYYQQLVEAMGRWGVPENPGNVPPSGDSTGVLASANGGSNDLFPGLPGKTGTPGRWLPGRGLPLQVSNGKIGWTPRMLVICATPISWVSSKTLKDRFEKARTAVVGMYNSRKRPGERAGIAARDAGPVAGCGDAAGGSGFRRL